MFIKLLLIGFAGAMGTLARYGLAGLIQRLSGESFPWGTASVNLIGSFLFGIIFIASTERNLISADARLYILTGFMGAFTTFSTFMFESGTFLRDSQPMLWAANIFGQVLLGTAFLLIGMAVGKML